mgnify:CR=1 FL=1
MNLINRIESESKAAAMGSEPETRNLINRIESQTI